MEFIFSNPDYFKRTPTENKKPSGCKRFDSCSAPICPYYGGDIWYPDEEICMNKAFSRLLWIKNQRKIAKKSQNSDTFFTLRMLEQNCVIRAGITGIDPDMKLEDTEKEVNKWLKNHPVKKELNPEKRTELAERGRKALQDFHSRDKSI